MTPHRHRFPGFWRPQRVPWGAVEIDWKHPLAWGLVNAWLPGLNWTDYVTGSRGSVYNGSPGFSTNVYGPSYTGATATSQDAIKVGSGHVLGGLVNASVAAGGVWPATQAQGAIYCERAVSGLDIWKLQAGSPSTKVATWIYRDDNSNIFLGVAGASRIVRDNTFHNIAVVKNGTAFSQYVDGSLDASTTLATTNNFTNANTQILIGGDAADGTIVNAGLLSYVYTYSRALSAQEVLLLKLEPFSFFKPKAPLRPRYLAPAVQATSHYGPRLIRLD